MSGASRDAPYEKLFSIPNAPYPTISLTFPAMYCMCALPHR